METRFFSSARRAQRHFGRLADNCNVTLRRQLIQPPTQFIPQPTFQQSGEHLHVPLLLVPIAYVAAIVPAYTHAVILVRFEPVGEMRIGLVKDTAKTLLRLGQADWPGLSQELSSAFRFFEAGDLLISYRTQNLVFVLDPETLKIKWWRVGAWSKQHDPDWHPNGTITVFSNNSSNRNASNRQYSDIVAIHPLTLQHKIVVDGEDYDFYSQVNGMQTQTPFETYMITSTDQGWIFEVDAKGDIVFSFINTYDRENSQSLNVSNAYRFDVNYFTGEFWKQCAAND